MTKIYCFSATGRTLEIAREFERRLGCGIEMISRDTEACPCELSIVIFPTYCQNLPDPVRNFLPKMRSKRAVLIATYGKMAHGRVLLDAKELINSKVIAAAYIPIGHSYLGEPTGLDPDIIEPIFEKIDSETEASIPPHRKNPLADIAPAARSRTGVKLKRSDACTSCGVCTAACPMGAIENGLADRRCIRCLRCVSICPEGALSFSLNAFMKLYLSKSRKNELKIYT